MPSAPRSSGAPASSSSQPRPFAFTSTGDRYGWTEGDDGRGHLTLFVENGRVRDMPGGAQLLTGAAQDRRDARRRHSASPPNQNIIIANVPAERAGEIEAHRRASTACSRHASGLRRNAMACVALPTCGLALAESERYLPDLIDALDERLAAHGLADDDIVIRMTGCPNGCARPYLAEIGLVGKGPGPLQPLSRRGVRRLAAVQALRRGPRPRRHRRRARSAVRRLCAGARRRASASATS